MAGITQKSCATLFPLWSIKKQLWGILIQKTYEKFKIEVLCKNGSILPFEDSFSGLQN